MWLTGSSDWVHDRFDDDRYDRRHAQNEFDRYEHNGRAQDSYVSAVFTRRRHDADGKKRNGTKLRIDNIHYELTEEDLRVSLSLLAGQSGANILQSLFERKGPVLSVKMLYDRMDRSTGTAFVTYDDSRDARDAIHDFDGQNANGQPIRITIVPSGPTGPPPPKAGGSLFDRMEAPPRSLFDRIGGRDVDGRDEVVGRRRRQRSDSPRKSRPTPDGIDRYVPGRRATSRSPVRRRGTPRESGRRPGERRERGGRGGPRRARTDEDGRPLVQGRPRKTAEELDAEMADYWGGNNEGEAANGNGGANGAAPAAAADQDEDMVL
jgi:THO complex subunit 4